MTDTVLTAKRTDSTGETAHGIPGEWAIYSDVVGWLVDTCATGAWSWDVSEALSMSHASMAQTLLTFAADIEVPPSSLALIRIK